MSKLIYLIPFAGGYAGVLLARWMFPVRGPKRPKWMWPEDYAQPKPTKEEPPKN